MPGPLDGVRVVEVASWTFVPAAAAILADLGADVVKVEPPTGDPQRGLRNVWNRGEGPNPFVELPNRGKRSVTLDLGTDAGHDTLLDLVAPADVFLTSYLAPVRARLRIDVADIKAANPRVVYVRGTGWGPNGPMADRGGFDLACGWASSGLAHKLADGGEPPPQPAAFFDLQGANTIAGAVGTALFQRERTGEAPVVDVALLNVGMWAMSPDIMNAPYVGDVPPLPHADAGNPLANWYRTSDDRWLYLVCLQPDRHWAELCRLLGRPDLATDERFTDAGVRFKHRRECVAELDALFATVTLDEVAAALEGFTGVWAPVLSTTELVDHPQVAANGYLPEVPGPAGPFRVVAAPVQFDGSSHAPRAAAPELGQHTEEVLLEAGLTWDDITARRAAGALG